MDWDTYFIQMAELIAQKSKDPSTKVGCVIVGPDNEVRSTGYNGFPRGVIETVEAERPYPVEVTRDPIRNEYIITSSCGEKIPVPAHQIESDALGHGDITEALMASASLHPHFMEPECPHVLHPERWERPMKYDLVEHAERNAVYNAARVGVPLKGCRAYLNWEPYPCKECAKAFIQAGIVEVIGPNKEFPNHKKPDGTDQWAAGDQWKFTVSRTLMDEAGVTYREVEWNE